jgi:hypothetical protein
MVFVALLALTAMLSASGASAQSAADNAMSERIGSALKGSGLLRDYRVGVKYQDGVAWLSGTVTDAQQAETAVRLAREVHGVSHVISQLQFPNNSAAPMRGRIQDSSRQVEPGMFGAGSSGVMQAYADAGSTRTPQNQQWAPPTGRQLQASRARQMPRSNMPLPTRRTMNGGPPIRQVAAHQGLYPAGGACPPNAMMGGGPTMGGPATIDGASGMGGPVPVGFFPHGSGRGPSYDNAQMPGYAWPSYAAYPNYAALTYPQQYSPTAWPYIGPFYPYPQVPLAWRKVALEWDDGWWFLDFSAHNSSH